MKKAIDNFRKLRFDVVESKKKEVPSELMFKYTDVETKAVNRCKISFYNIANIVSHPKNKATAYELLLIFYNDKSGCLYIKTTKALVKKILTWYDANVKIAKKRGSSAWIY